MRALIIAAAYLLIATAFVPGTAATREPVGGCGADAIVEACFPVCVTTPCDPYVCVNTHPEPVCARP